MNFTRRTLVLAAVAALALAGAPALAASVPDQIVAQLQDMGFRNFDVSNTWLGRVRILAESTKYRREIIVDPRTGEILRDLWTNLDGSPASAQISTSSGNVDDDHSGSGGGDDGGNSGPGGGDDDEDDDDEDNSGSGSGSSGSGSEGSGSGDDDDDNDDDDDDDDD